MGTSRPRLNPRPALTFDDVLLVPRHSTVHPRNVDVKSRFTRGIPLKISGVPIVDAAGKLVGIITNRDLQFERQLDRPIRDAMTREKLVTAPVGTDLDEAEKILAQHRIEKLPVVDERGVLKGLITIKDI